MEPSVSVIIPAFNAEETIKQTLRSAQMQTYRNLELIVVDDGSRDFTPNIVSKFASEDPRIRLIQQGNSGVAAARNAGLAASNGSLIAPLDADDLWHPLKIELQVNSFVKNGQRADLDYCWFVDIDKQAAITRCHSSRFEGHVYEALILDNFLGNSSVPLIRREALEGIGGWDTKLRAANGQGCEDWLLYLKIAEKSQFTVTPAFLVGYRQLGAMSGNVGQMRRSYEMTMAHARSARPEIARSQFIRSRMNFDLYISGMCWDSSRQIAGLWFMLLSVVRNPFDWRHVAEVLHAAARRLFRTRQANPYSAAVKFGSTFHGLKFDLLQPYAQCDLCDPSYEKSLSMKANRGAKK